jgi:hypothetical protein
MVDERVLNLLPPGHLAGPFDRADLSVTSYPQSDALIGDLEAGYLPVVGVVTTPGFMTLSNGILTEPGKHLDNHAVLLVGAAAYDGPGGGVIEPGDIFMCIQNSWGDTWGTRGFGLIGPRAWQDMVLISATLDTV